MREGELWWFDNKAVHEARNDSASDRIHLIFDLIPADRQVPAGTEHPAALLDAEHAGRDMKAIEEVARAVALYLSAREHPRDWARLLDEADLLRVAEKKPIAALARLFWPEIRSSRRARYESAVGWSLGLLDIGAIGPDAVSRAIVSAGGLEAVHERWRGDRDAALYSFEPDAADRRDREIVAEQAAAG